jgi:hypothetical protein
MCRVNNNNNYNNNVTYLGVCDYRRSMDWWTEFIIHLYSPLGTTGNYSVIADVDTLQITTR